MNIVTIVILGLLFLLVLMAFRSSQPRRQVTFEQDYQDWGLNWDWPVTWNFDWGGGPGYDRNVILHEKGPYNPGGHGGFRGGYAHGR
jgi:hypothetical protein